MHSPRGTIAVLDLGENSRIARKDAVANGDKAFRKLERHTLLEWTIRRLAESTLLDTIAVTGPSRFETQILNSNLCHAVWLPSDKACAVVRARDAMDRLDARWALFVSPSCPFVDPVLVDRLIRSAWSHPECDYIGYFSQQRPQFCVSGLGLTGEICSRRCVESILDAQAPELHESMSVAARVQNVPDAFQMRLLPLPEALDKDGLRFTVETKEDWDQGHMLIDAGADDFDWQRLATAVRIDRAHAVSEPASKSHGKVGSPR